VEEVIGNCVMRGCTVRTADVMLLERGLWLVWGGLWRFLVGKTESKRPLEDLGIDGSVSYKILNEIGLDAVND
jgi:hypothetical protein